MNKMNEGEGSRWKEREEAQAEGGWEDEKRDINEQGKSCKDTHTGAHIHHLRVGEEGIGER